MKGEFVIAVHALVYLNYKKTKVSSEELAENICTNPARIRKVMACLKKAGLVKSKEGAEGGYLIAKEAGGITLADVSAAVDDKPISKVWYSGDIEKKCLIASGMGGLMEDIISDLNLKCKDYLESITIKSLASRIVKIHSQK